MSVVGYIGPAIGALGALMVVIGSVMPWAVAQTLFGTINVAGTEGDGIITLFLGVALAGSAVLTAFVRQLWLAILQAVFAAGVAALSLWELADVTSGLDDAGNEFVRTSVGSGLFVLLLGSLAAVGAAIVHIGVSATR